MAKKTQMVEEVTADPIEEAPGAGTGVELAVGRVMAIHGAQSLVEVGDRLFNCYLSGRLKHQRNSGHDDSKAGLRTGDFWKKDTTALRGRWARSREQAPLASPIAVGDRVEVRLSDDGSGMILECLERKTWLGRVRPTKGPQVIAANIDIALVVMAAAEPEPDFFLLDQFLVQATAGGMEPWVVFNKTDMLPDSLAASLPEAEVYRGIGYPVFSTSARTGAGVSELEQALTGKTAILVGPSGVGKSKIVNHLIPEADAEVGEISEWSGRGQHTTTAVAMYPLPSGGYLVDAPGIRRITLWQVEQAQLPHFFPEFEAHSGGCEYQPCTHLEEEQCSVRAAVEAGMISTQRYQHYREMRTSRW